MKKLFFFIPFILVVACSEQKTAQTYTVEYLLEHDDVRQTVIEDCKSRIKTISERESVMKETNCRNAVDAQNQFIKKFNSSKNTGHRESTRAFSNASVASATK